MKKHKQKEEPSKLRKIAKNVSRQKRRKKFGLRGIVKHVSKR
jgi:hypothetical protein